MNHRADVDEGLDTFDEEQDRAAAEQMFRDNPQLVVFSWSVDRELSFTAARVTTIDLRGDRRLITERPKPGPPAPSIFDFSEGCVVAYGRVTLGVSKIDLGEHTKEIRWSDFGSVRRVS
jgi:hypothetical protein